MSPVVMRKRATTVWGRRPSASKFFPAALWMLILMSAAAPAAVWIGQDSPKEPAEDTCLRYQDPDTLDLEKKFVHPALDEGCAVCHFDCSQVFPSDEPGSATGHYLKGTEPDLCLQCHAELHPDLTVSHDSQPLEQTRCSGCHDAHASNVPKRLPEFSHGPYDARLCSACHPEPINGKVALVADDVNTLCYGCHADIKMRIESAKSSHGLLAESNSSCADCHDPHAAELVFMLTKPVYDLCIGCHEGKPEEAPAPKQPPRRRSGIPSLNEVMGSQRYEDTTKEGSKYIDLSLEHVHEPVRKSCTLCHDAHASQYTAELHAPVYDICMDCHGENAEKILNGDQPFPFLGGLVSLPPKMFEKLPYLDLTSEYIHEPVRQSCVFCHDAHASENPVKLNAPLHNLCIACHKDSNARSIMNSNRPFPLFGGRVRLQPKQFENLKEIHLVKGDTIGHPMQRHPVYIPATNKDPEFNCLDCHTSHASSTGLRRWKSDNRDDICRECHEM